MAMTDVPFSERPREKLLARGAEALTDAELLAIFVRTGVPGRNAIEIAHDILIAVSYTHLTLPTTPYV